MDHCKKLLRTAAAAALTLSVATVAASASFGTGVVTEGPLRVRESASTDANVLDLVGEGQRVEVLEDVQDGWYKVACSGGTGYMSADYLNVTEGAAPEEGASALALVDTAALNVRAGASTDCEKTGSLSGGSIINVLGRADGWAQVEHKGLTGYVSDEYLVFGTREELEAAAAAGNDIISIAKKYLGTRYAYGGASPSGFDCSGFVYYVAKQAGYSVPRTGSAMWTSGYTEVDRGSLKSGDIVFFTNTGGSNYITHVGLYIGGNQFIHSSSPRSGGVIISSMSDGYYGPRYVGARRAFT